MKSFFAVSYIALGILTTSISCFATTIGISTLEQPVNLGAHSDPTRIPLGRVGVISNYDYGIHSKITESRPSPLGAMKWKNGSELDQNLASVFGISIEIPDSSQVRAAPVTLRLNNWTPPAYSPYSKEQVLTATMWCLIRSAGGTKERPLEILVVTENPDDKLLEAKYSGKYARDIEEHTKPDPALKVGDTVIQEDNRGVAWVVFPNVTRDASFKPLPYGMIVLENFGDTDSAWHLLPVWGNGEQPKSALELNEYTVNICYSAYQFMGLRNANSFLDQGGSRSFVVTELEKSVEVDLGSPGAKPDTLAATILALIITAQPTVDKPLVVSMTLEDYNLEEYAAFRKAADWKETRQQNENRTYYELKCEFVWNPTTRKLMNGSVPLVTSSDHKWISPVQ